MEVVERERPLPLPKSFGPELRQQPVHGVAVDVQVPNLPVRRRLRQHARHRTPLRGVGKLADVAHEPLQRRRDAVEARAYGVGEVHQLRRLIRRDLGEPFDRRRHAVRCFGHRLATESRWRKWRRASTTLSKITPTFLLMASARAAHSGL